MKNLYTESSYDRNERPRAFPFYQDYQQNTYFAPNQGTEENLLFDPKGVSDPMNWGATPKFTGEPTEAESRTLNQIQSLAFANVLNNSLVTLGTDPSQGLYLRQLIGQAAMQPVAVADEDINEAGIAREQTRLNDLMAQPEDRLQQSGMGDLITQSMSKLAYMKARHNNTLVIPDTNIANYYRGQGWFGNIVGGIADMVMTVYDTAMDYNPAAPSVISPTTVPALQRMGGDGLRVLRSMGFNNTELLADIEKETGGLPSTSTADMVALVESFDRNFDYKTWFNETIALDPTVRDGLLNYGVTEELFKESRNSTHALMTLMSKMNVSDIQRRLSNYVPTTYQSIYGFAASFKDGFVGSLDTAAEIALEIGGTVAVDAAIGAGLLGAPTAGGAAPVGAVVGGVVGLAKAGQILYKGLSAAKKVMSSAWYLTGYGKLPRYAMQWGVIRTTGASALVGATANSLIDYVGQKENIALANSLYFYNPDMQATVSMDEVVGAAAAGALFGASLGMVGHVISTVAVRGNNAAARNAFAQQGMDPAFAPQQRNPFQRTADNIAAFRNRKAVAIQDPIAGAIQTAVSKGVDPTVVDINSAARTTSTAIDAASVASNPKDAANLPEHSLNRRQANEPMKAFTIRAVLGKFVTSINDLLDADSMGGRFSLLTPREQYLTLLRSEDNMRTFADMTAFEENAVNTAAGKLIPTPTVDPLTGRVDNPSANVAKLYAELDAARSTLDKTISKEDRAEAIAAHKNGTELAPRTISGAVDKATSNVKGIMENASEGRHNPSTAKGPKVEQQATTGVPSGENAAQGTTAPALPTQKKVDEITQDAAADMSLLTDEELEDPKVTGAIERNVTRQLFGGQKEHTLRSLSRGLAKARKLSLEQQGKINSTLDSPRSFIQQATGNPTYIKNFYDRLEALVGLGHITDIDRRIILASTVNTPFNSNVAAKISDMGTRGDDRASTSLQGDIKIGKLDTSVAGNTRVENVLHEIGHVEELHAYGQSLMDLRKLFTSEQAFLDAAQQVLGTDNFNKYYLAGNTQELMAQVKAKMMIDEVRLAVFLKTTNSTAVEKTLLAHALRIGTSLIEVFTSLKLSKVDAEDGMYTAVKEILSKLETGAKPLMTRIVYQQRVAGALKSFPTGKLTPEQKVAFAKELNAKISEDFTKNSAELKDMMFTKDEVESLHALTAHSDGSIDPIRLDAYLNVKREGITVKSKAKFAKTFQSYVEINQRYLASTTDIYIASMKENGYKAVPANPIVMDASLSKRDQIAALREYHRELAPDEMVVTPSYMDVTFGNFNGDLALQFLIDSSTEPTLMMAPGSSLANPEIMNVKVAEFAKKHFGNRKAKNGSLVSENFMRWFGDSKVVDAEGNPLIVYHGTDSIVDFTSFKESVTGRYGKGNYFTTNSIIAEKFVRDVSDFNKEKKPRIIPVFVSIKKPYVTIKDEFFVENMLKELGLTIEDYYKKAKEIHAKTFTKMDRLKGKSLEEFDDAKPAAITELLREGGFDGIQINFGKGDLYFIAFGSNQSKSSIANSGDFDSLDPDIMFAPQAKSSVAYTPELVVQRLAFLSTNLKDAPATAADFKKAMQGMLGLDDDLFDALSAVKGTVNPEQMAGYHQMVIRRVVDALMSEKVAVGPNGVRRLNSVEREMNLVRASKQTEGTKAAKLERARTEPVEDMPADTTDSKLYPNNPMTATMLENFWQDSTTFKQVAARLKASSSLNDQGVLDAISDAMLKVKAKGVAILKDAEGNGRSRNAVINYIVVSAKNANLDAKGLKVSRAGLTPDSWKDFLETENDILRSSGEEEITFNGTPTQHMAAEKKKGSELYARFKKAYAKSYIEGGEDGAVTGATYTQAAEPKVSQIKAEGLSIMVDYATRLEYNLYSTRDSGWQKFVVTNLMEGKSYAEIVALAKENGFPNKKAGNVADAIDAVRSKFRKMLEEKTGVSLKDMSDDEVMASGVLDSLEELAKAADSARETAPVEDLAPERKSSSEILAETEKSATEQTNSDELTAALDTKEPTSQPVIAPEGSKGPVTAVVQVDGEAVGPLTPHVAPKTAEAVAKNPKTPKARFTSSTPKKVVVFTTGDARAMLKATGNVGKLFFASMKTMEGLLNALPKSALKDTDIAATIKILKKMIAAGEEKAAVAKFLALMKHLDIEAVKIIDPKDGRTVMNFIFAEQAWSYGGISRFKAAPKKAKPARVKPAPETAAQKEARKFVAIAKNEIENKPEVIAVEPTVDTPTEAAPDGTQVPVMEPKEVPSNEIAGGTVVPVVSEHDRIVTGLTEGNEALRDGGVDATSFTALFKKFVRSLSKDAKKKLGTVLPEEFKDLFMKFVELNAAIMHDNRTIFGDHKIVGKFWKQVDTMLAVEDGLQMKDTMRVRLTMKEIYAMAAAQVSTKQHRFLPPLTHENITIKNGKFGLRDVSKETQGVLARRDTGPIIAYTPEEIAARKASAAATAAAGPIGPVTPPKQPKTPPTVKEVLDETFNPENDPKVAAEAEAILQDSDRLDSIFKRVAASYSQLLRQNNLASWFIGGSERANRNRWRAFMSKTVGAIQHGSKLNVTIRAMDAKVRFFAMFMDDSRAMTGQLVSPDGTPIRSAAKSKQEAVMFTANLTRIHHALAAEAAVLKMTPAERKLLQRMQITAWQRKTTPTAQEMSAALGGKDFVKMASILENYRKEMLHLNTEMLKLEEKTGWRTVTKNGKPVEADAYLPIQLHIQKLMSVMGDNKAYEALLKSIVATRRAAKMADSQLDRNTLITMGIMNLKDNSRFYTQDREFALTENITLDADTLKKLKKYETTTTESKDFTKTLGENGRDFFIIQEGGNRATVYMMPTETKHLSDADLKKYLDTVSGDQTHVTKTWKNELDNKDLVSVEMKELLDFKSRQGRYHHTKNTMVNNRPTIDANHHDEAFSTVRNFSVDELISNKELFEVSRTDLHAAYQNFSRYRMFDLLFQESIDQLAGSTGLRPKEFFRLIEEKIKADADKLSQGMSIDSRAAIQKDIDDGMGRLVWQYAEYNGTISRSGSESRVGQNIARTVRGIATTSSGLGYGLSQSPETTMEILKNMPQTKGLSVPVGGFRYLTSLLKFWDRKDSATKMQVGDLITSLEEYSKDHSTHFNEGIADIDFDTDLNSPYRAIWNSGRNSEGMTGQMADFFQRTGQTAVLAGGVTDGTNLARYYGKARHVRDLTAMMRDGKLKEFLRLRALPENRAAMQKLLEGSFASAAEERKLWKMHKSLARQAKGLDPFLALKAIKVGLDNPAKLEALMYGMNAANALDGVLDFRDLHMVYRDLKNMKSPPIDPEVYRAAATDFQYGVEALIRKRTVTHGFGLNKNLSVFNTQDEVGKLVNTLTSYMRSWFDDVALNAPERGAVGLMFGGILSVAVVETMISLLREWMSGREMEDMIAELENDPYEYVLKFVSRMPIFGVMTPVFEGLLKTAKYMSGGAQSGGSGLIDTLSQVGGGSPNIGINSAMSMLKTTGEAGTDLVTGAMEGDTQLMAKGALRVPGHFFNKTIYAAPVRVMEEAMDLDDKHTAQFIIDGLQKKPYRYLSQQRGGRRGGSSRAAPQAPSAVPVTTQTMPQSAALKAASRPEMGRQVKEYVAPAPPSKPNSGVSERLGKLLDNPSYTPTPPM